MKQTVEREPLVNAFAANHGDYREATVVDLSGELGGGRQKTFRVLRNVSSVVDRWLLEGGPGFEEPQALAIQHCRKLWAASGTLGRTVSHYGEFGQPGGRSPEGWTDMDALTQLALYERQIPRPYWTVFESLARDGFTAGIAGELLANNTAQQSAAAKSCVGFVASLIAMWRGY